LILGQTRGNQKLLEAKKPEIFNGISPGDAE